MTMQRLMPRYAKVVPDCMCVRVILTPHSTCFRYIGISVGIHFVRQLLKVFLGPNITDGRMWIPTLCCMWLTFILIFNNVNKGYHLITKQLIMNLRKVNFRLCQEDGYQPGLDTENDESTQMRSGYFHCWIPDIVHNPKTGDRMPAMNALVEDAGTGKLYSLPYSLLEFEPINNPFFDPCKDI